MSFALTLSLNVCFCRDLPSWRRVRWSHAFLLGACEAAGRSSRVLCKLQAAWSYIIHLSHHWRDLVFSTCLSNLLTSNSQIPFSLYSEGQSVLIPRVSTTNLSKPLASLRYTICVLGASAVRAPAKAIFENEISFSLRTIEFPLNG